MHVQANCDQFDLQECSTYIYLSVGLIQTTCNREMNLKKHDGLIN